MSVFDSILSPVKRKIDGIKEDMERSKLEDDAFKQAQHEAKMESAGKRAKALEEAKLQKELKDIKKGKKPKPSGLRAALENFSAGMTDNNSDIGFNPDYMYGESRPKVKRKGARKAKPKIRMPKRKSNGKTITIKV